MNKINTDEMYYIGSIHSNKYGTYEVIGIEPNDGHGHAYRKIRFTNTGYETIARADHLNTGQIRDPLYPSVCGIGYMGVLGNITRELYIRDYERWRCMIKRCYNKKNKDYYRYGGAGITVCERWHCFKNYYDDIKELPNYDKYNADPNNWHLDKDYLQQNVPIEQRVYSPSTCLFLNTKDNSRYKRNTGSNNQCGYYGVSKYFNSNNYHAKTSCFGYPHEIGVYSSIELAAGAVNYYLSTYEPNKELNNVPTLTIEEVMKYDLRKKKMQMCKNVKKKENKQLPTMAASELTPAQVLGPALQHFVIREPVEMCTLVTSK